MVNNSLLFLLVVMFTSLAFGQEVQLNGQITNTKDVEGIHILNTTSRYNTIANAKGVFTILAQKGDSLIVSSIHYVPKAIVISEDVIQSQKITITLSAMVNELDEVVLGPNLSGNLTADLKNIKTEEAINFDDVGIPGFKGKPEEKIAPAYTITSPTAVNLEALYNHLSGYYRKLRLRRKWENQNISVVQLINYYTPSFFEEAFAIPENRLYDFLLYCMETTQIQDDFKRQNFARVLNTLESQSLVYVKRLSESKNEALIKKEE